MSEAENPSWKNEESKAPYNEEKARADFGDEFVDRLKKDQEERWTHAIQMLNTYGTLVPGKEFHGDWWQLAMLFKNLEDDAKPRPDGTTIKPEERLHAWNEWYTRTVASKHEYIHLEHAYLFDAHLEHAKLFGAHLEHAHLTAAHLEHADLSGAHLEHAFLLHAHLEHAVLSYAHLEQAELSDARLENVSLFKAHLEYARLFDAHLEYALLFDAHLKHARLDEAHLEHANLTFAHLEHANFRGAFLKGAELHWADLSEAVVRGASGLLFNENRVRDINIEGDAPDPWSVLRREYTGPWFFVHLLLLMVFFAPYIGRAAYLSATGKMEQWTIDQYATLGERLEEMPGPVRELSRTHAELERRFYETHEKRRAVWVLLGVPAGWRWVLPIVVIVYNFLRGYLTLRVSMLRDAEKRSQHSPALEEYYGMWHPWKVMGHRQSGWKRWHGWLVGWLGAVDAFFTGRPGWGNRFGESFSERKDPGLWGIGRRAWQWLSEAPLRFGLYRLHIIARLMLIAVLVVVGHHMWDWIRNTWVLVPKG